MIICFEASATRGFFYIKKMELLYEKATKDEIMGCLDTLELPYKQALDLLKSPTPLDDCYQRWLKTDSSYFPDLHNCVEETAKQLEKERGAKGLEER